MKRTLVTGACLLPVSYTHLERRQAEVYRTRIEELQKRFNQPTVSTSPTPSQDADALIALWPEPVSYTHLYVSTFFHFPLFSR